MRSITLPLSASLVAASLILLVPSAARGGGLASPSPSLLPHLTLTGQSLCPSTAASTAPSTLLPSLAGQDKAIPLQLDGGSSVWRSITFTWADDGSAMATVYVFNQNLGTFVTGKEYWYANRDTLSKLGRTGLTITVTDSNSLTPPSDPGYTVEQRFTQTQSPGWGTGWTTDPVSSGGYLYTGPSGYYLRLKNTTLTPPTINEVTWYQVLSSGSPANIDPAGSWANSGTGSVTVPSGSTGYDINQASG